MPSTRPSSTASDGRLRPARGERGAERLEHAAEQEGQRLEAVHRPVELERRLEPLGERRGDEDAVVLAAGEPREAGALGPEALGEGDGGSRARSPIVRRPQRRKSSRRSASTSRSSRGSGARAARLASRGHDGEPGTRPREDERRRAGEGEGGLGLDRARRGRVEERAAERLRGRPQAAEAREVEEHGRRRGGLDARRERRARRRRARPPRGGVGESAGRRTRVASRGALRAAAARAKSARAQRRGARPARARRARARSRAGPGGPDQRGATGSRASAAPAGAAGHVLLGHEHDRRGRALDEALQAQPGGGRQAPALARGAGEVERHHVEEPGRGERRHRGRGVGERLRRRLLGRDPRPAQPEQPREVHARGGGGSGVEPVERVDEGGERPAARRPREERRGGRRCGPRRRGRGPPRARPRGKPPPRSASTSAMPVASGRSRRSSPRSGGASACRRRARSRSSRARLRSAGDGVGASAGRGTALMAFAFSSLSISAAERSAVNPEDLVVGRRPTPIPRLRPDGAQCV